MKKSKPSKHAWGAKYSPVVALRLLLTFRQLQRRNIILGRIELARKHLAAVEFLHFFVEKFVSLSNRVKT